MVIKNYNEFINEEKGYLRNLLLSAVLSLGLSKSQAQSIKNDQDKLSVVDSIINYNKKPLGLNVLKVDLATKVDNPDKFIKNYLTIMPDKTIVVRPSFLEGLEIHGNLSNKSFSIVYNIKF